MIIESNYTENDKPKIGDIITYIKSQIAIEKNYLLKSYIGRTGKLIEVDRKKSRNLGFENMILMSDGFAFPCHTEELFKIDL